MDASVVEDLEDEQQLPSVPRGSRTRWMLMQIEGHHASKPSSTLEIGYVRDTLTLMA